MGGTDATITIPSVMIAQNSGTALRALVAPSGKMRRRLRSRCRSTPRSTPTSSSTSSGTA